MHITMAGVCALRKLRKALQMDVGSEFPDAVLPELLMLFDVCKSLELPPGHTSDVLGRTAMTGIQRHLDSTVIPYSAKTAPQVITLEPKYFTPIWD